MGRVPPGNSAEEDMNKNVNLIRKSLQGILALEGGGTGSELGTQLEEFPRGKDLQPCSFFPIPVGFTGKWRVFTKDSEPLPTPAPIRPAHPGWELLVQHRPASVSCFWGCPQQSATCREACDKQM